MTFEEELQALLNASVGASFEDIEKAVVTLHCKYGREVPPPITGEIVSLEPEDKFG